MTTPRLTQRQIREEKVRKQPRPAAESLDGFTVALISRKQAESIIMEYEWLRSMGASTMFVGLISPAGELHGVACFGSGPGGNIRTLIGSPALCLERGACVHYAHRNAASFLINRACRVIYEATGTPLFYAYSDPEAGEYGAVYQAAGWAYVGQGLDGKKVRRERRMVLPPGADRHDPAAWKTTRALRTNSHHLTYEKAEAAGWTLEWRAAKHVYAVHVGDPRERKRWRKQLAARLKADYGGPFPYPSPRPALKMRNA